MWHFETWVAIKERRPGGDMYVMVKSIKDEVSIASEEKKESTGAALSPTLCGAIWIKTPCPALF